MIPATSGLIYTPLFVNPTILGALPGYYNSAYGITATVSPSRRLYISVGMYDGNLARGVQTGAEAGPTFNGYRFQIGEVGTAWLLGAYNLPGSFAVGLWDQSGTLNLSTPQATITEHGTHGGYGFGSQRVWRGENGARGVSAFVQFGANDLRTCLRPGTLGWRHGFRALRCKARRFTGRWNCVVPDKSQPKLETKRGSAAGL